MRLSPRKYNRFNNVPLVNFLIDFNELFPKTQRCFATFSNSASDPGRLWILALLNNCRVAWSVHGPDSIILRVMNLFDRKEFLIIEKESLLVLTCGPSQNCLASLEPYEFVFAMRS
ncbi:hypothetical protein TNCV_1601811 [Trichonephila clavipes]|nr:hypothetical protein TNCV_1601811 [Trichonephila clavipes]